MDIHETPAIDLYLDLMKKVLTASVYDESAWEIIDYNAKKKSSPGSLKYYFDHLSHFIEKQLLRRSVLLIRKTPYNEEKRNEGRDWPLFGYTMVGHKRLDNVRKCIEDVIRNDVPGDLVEAGAWRGGTAIFMRAILRAYEDECRNVWVADSFEGMPLPLNKDDGWDLSKVGYLKVPLDQVKSNFRKFGLLDERVRFLKGWFRDTLSSAPIKEIAVLRLDGDMYSSTMDSLQSLYHKINHDGYIIIDDYYSWRSCHNAVNDFRNEKSIKSPIKKIDSHGAYWKKKSG